MSFIWEVFQAQLILSLIFGVPTLVCVIILMLVKYYCERKIDAMNRRKDKNQ